MHILLYTALALIHPQEEAALRTIQNIRNRAAHFDRKGRGFDVLFDSQQTADQVDHLAKVLNCELESRDLEAVRSTFIVSARLLASKVLIRLLDVRRPSPLRTIKEVANEIRETSDSPAIQMFREAEEEAREGRPERLREMMQTIPKAICDALSQLSDQEPSD